MIPKSHPQSPQLCRFRSLLTSIAVLSVSRAKSTTFYYIQGGCVKSAHSAGRWNFDPCRVCYDPVVRPICADCVGAIAGGRPDSCPYHVFSSHLAVLSILSTMLRRTRFTTEAAAGTDSRLPDCLCVIIIAIRCRTERRSSGYGSFTTRNLPRSHLPPLDRWRDHSRLSTQFACRRPVPMRLQQRGEHMLDMPT